MKTLTETLNTLRRSNKNNWYTFVGTIDGKTIRAKGYGTWLQVLDVDGIKHGSTMDLNVTQFKSHIDKAMEYHNTN